MEGRRSRETIDRRQDLRMQILTRLLIEIVKFADRDHRHRTRLQGFRSNGVRYRPREWFERSLSTSDRQALSRAMRQLEETGMVVRLTEPKRDRVLYVRPTPLGLRSALEHADDNVDMDALIRSLRRTWWGRELASVPAEERVSLGDL